MKKISLIIFLIILGKLFAEEVKKDSMRVYVLEEFCVIAERPSESIGVIDLRDFSEIKKTSELNIGEAVQDVNGVFLTSGGKNGADLSIRGFNSKQVKILLDGKPLSGGYFGEVDLNNIPVSDIKQIQVLKGPVSSLYGSNTMGGVINIVSRAPNNKSWFKTGFEFRRNNTNKQYLSSSRSFEIFDYSVYFSRNNTDGFMLSNDFEPTESENGKIRDHTAKEQFDFQTKLNTTIFDMHSIGFQMGYSFMNTKDIPCSIYEKTYRQLIDWKRYQFSSQGSFQILYNMMLHSNIYYDHYDDFYAEYKDSDYQQMYSGWPSRIKNWTLGTNHRLEWEISNNMEIFTGFQYETEEYKRNGGPSYPIEDGWVSNDLSQMNFFAQTSFKMFENKLILTGGSAVSTFTQNGREKSIFHFEPSFGATYTTEKFCEISLAFSKNTNYPCLRQFFSSSKGNPELKEETALKTEISIKKPFFLFEKAGSLNSSIFYNEVDDLIGVNGDNYDNYDNVSSYGSEVSLKFDWLFMHQFDYAYLEYTNDSTRPLDGSPRNVFSIKETINFPHNIEFIYKGEWSDVYLSENDDVMHVLPSKWMNSAILNMKIGRNKLLFGIDNIFDLDYQEKYGYPGPGRDFVFGFETEF